MLCNCKWQFLHMSRRISSSIDSKSAWSYRKLTTTSTPMCRKGPGLTSIRTSTNICTNSFSTSVSCTQHSCSWTLNLIPCVPPSETTASTVTIHLQYSRELLLFAAAAISTSLLIHEDMSHGYILPLNIQYFPWSPLCTWKSWSFLYSIFLSCTSCWSPQDLVHWEKLFVYNQVQFVQSHMLSRPLAWWEIKHIPYFDG